MCHLTAPCVFKTIVCNDANVERFWVNTEILTMIVALQCSSRACFSEQMFDLLRDCCLLGISGWMGWGAAWDSGIVLGIVDGGSGRGAQVH